MPQVREGDTVIAAAHGGKIYAFSGSAGQTRLEVFDPVANSWSTRPNWTYGIYDGGAAVVGDKIYFLRETSEPGGYKRVASYDPASGSWSDGRLVPANPPSGDEEWSYSVASLGGFVWVIQSVRASWSSGGQTASGRLFKYNSTDSSLQEVQDGATQLQHAIMPGVAASDTRVFVVGGFSGRAYNRNFLKLNQSSDLGVTLPPNQSPTANAGGPYSVAEGGSVGLSGSGSDPDGDPLTYSWDLDNNGSFETAGQNPTFSAVGRDGPSSQVVVLQVCDNKGACATASATVNIANVAPTVQVAGQATNYSGQTHQLTATFTDPGLADTHTATINWGDGSAVEGVPVVQGQGSGSLSGSHQYFSPGIYNIVVTVTDDDGASGSATQVKTVSRLPVKIDIKPGSFPNSINLRNKGNVPVGVFTGVYEGLGFDATALKRISLVFAGAPDLGIGKSPQDLDGDGDLDMVFHFDTPKLDLTSGSTQACLTGETNGGIFFQGCDSVRIVPP